MTYESLRQYILRNPDDFIRLLGDVLPSETFDYIMQLLDERSLAEASIELTRMLRLNQLTLKELSQNESDGSVTVTRPSRKLGLDESPGSLERPTGSASAVPSLESPE